MTVYLGHLSIPLLTTIRPSMNIVEKSRSAFLVLERNVRRNSLAKNCVIHNAAHLDQSQLDSMTISGDSLYIHNFTRTDMGTKSRKNKKQILNFVRKSEKVRQFIYMFNDMKMHEMHQVYQLMCPSNRENGMEGDGMDAQEMVFVEHFHQSFWENKHAITSKLTIRRLRGFF
ncbi:hypothetical protein ACOME3_001251 [Neoechinorhynchus agilis]